MNSLVIRELKFHILESLCNNTSLLGQALPISQEHLKYVIGLYECFNDNALGKLWTSSMPYLFPFIIEYRYAKTF